MGLTRDGRPHIGELAVIDLRGRYAAGAAGYLRRPLSTATRVVVHHSDTGSPTTIDDAVKLLDAIDTYHRTDAGHRWPAIGYHLAVDAHGNAYWLNDLTTISYHVADQNKDSVGVVLLGTYTDATPPLQQLLGARLLVEGIARETGTKISVVGHAEANPLSTECCPSKQWSEWRRYFDQTLTPRAAAAAALAQFDAVWGNANTIIQSAENVKNHLILSKQALGLG